MSKESEFTIFNNDGSKKVNTYKANNDKLFTTTNVDPK